MRKATIFMLFAVMVLGINAMANDKILKNDNPAGGDILVADECRIDCPAIWGQPPEDCDGNWALVTSDTDYGSGRGYFVFDDFDVAYFTGMITFWWCDLKYEGEWYECDEDHMDVNVMICRDDGTGKPEIDSPEYSYVLNTGKNMVCQLSSGYDLWSSTIYLPELCTLSSGFIGIQGIGNNDSCAFMWYNSTVGNGVNSWQWQDSIFVQTEYEQAFCLFGVLMEPTLTSDITIVSQNVPSINGDILFDLTLINPCGVPLYDIEGELFPTIGDCTSGTPYDFDLEKVLTSNLAYGDTFTGNYYYHINDVSSLGLSQAAINVSASFVDLITVWCCDEFRFYNPWGRTGGEVVWGDQWYERETDEIIPNSTSLGSNYPNPFNAITSIPFELSQARNVSLKVYNLSGQVVNELYNGYLDAGSHVVNWDASAVASGIYFYTLETGDITITKKMNLVK